MFESFSQAHRGTLTGYLETLRHENEDLRRALKASEDWKAECDVLRVRLANATAAHSNLMQLMEQHLREMQDQVAILNAIRRAR